MCKKHEYKIGHRFLNKKNGGCPPEIACSFSKGKFIFNNETYYYIIMEYVKGFTLFQYKIYKYKNHIKRKTFVKLFYNIVKGINYLHSKNIIHNDLHSSNIIITKKTNIKIIDLGNYKHINKNNKKYELYIKREIYNIGDIVEFLYTIVLPKEKIDLIKEIIDDCLQSNYKKRPDTHHLMKKLEDNFPYLKK